MLALGGQCSNPTAVEQQLGAMFGVLGGSQGKVGLAPAMASHLQAAGGLASATGHFVTFLCRQLVVEPAALLARPQTGSPGGQAGRRSGAGRGEPRPRGPPALPAGADRPARQPCLTRHHRAGPAHRPHPARRAVGPANQLLPPAPALRRC
jgi:hypothetical protein